MVQAGVEELREMHFGISFDDAVERIFLAMFFAGYESLSASAIKPSR